MSERDEYAALYRALARLDPEAQIVLRMHDMNSVAIADVARVRGVAQKPLYPLRKQSLAALERLLGAEGVTREVVRDLLASAFRDLDHEGARETGEARPSTEQYGQLLPDGMSSSPDASGSARLGRPSL